MLCTCAMHCQFDKSRLYQQYCWPIQSSHTLQQIWPPVWDPLNASNNSRKAFALQPEKVCTVIAIKECIRRSVKISKVTETWWRTAKHFLQLCSFGSNSIWCELRAEMMTWRDDNKRRIHRSTKLLFSCQKTKIKTKPQDQDLRHQDQDQDQNFSVQDQDQDFHNTVSWHLETKSHVCLFPRLPT